jgi:glycosyltransferase involved in cell wall biosynthesis
MPGGAVSLLYDDSAYVEAAGRPREPAGEGPAGLVGRQVAGREFLDAFFAHGSWTDLTAVVYNQASADSLARYFQAHPSAGSRRLRVVRMESFPDTFFPQPPAPLLWTPCPPDPAFAWARAAGGPGAFALSGVTHTLSTEAAARVLCELVTAPYEPFDALVCTSSAVTRMVRALTGAYADYLRDRFGGSPALRPRLETIPLGVNPERFRPPTPRERAERRAALRVADDAVAVLFVGRFAPHAKAHPFPMFQGVARAARQTGRPVHLILTGWAASPALLHAYLDGARAFAPGIPVSVVDGMDPAFRFAVWHAADVFTSLPDSIQETFGLVVLEAMASGLPVVATDWDGYRDLVEDGRTGFLVPTRMVEGATADATVRLLLHGIDYDAFLAECNQAVAVDLDQTAAAYARLLTDEPLRRRLGEAGRQRVLERFTWARVIAACEGLWRSQEAERRDWAGRHPSPAPRLPGPACFPAPEFSFAGYPSHLLDADARVEAAPDAGADLGLVLGLPLTSYARERRLADEPGLRALLAEARRPRTIADLDAVLRRLGTEPGRGRATLAWMLKYGLLRPVL